MDHEISPNVARLLTVSFVLIMVSVPAAQLAMEWRAAVFPSSLDVRHLAPRVDEIERVLGASTLVDEYAALRACNDRMVLDIHAYEATLKRDAWIVRWAVPHVQRVITGWLGGGNEDVHCGRDRWLFYRTDVEYLTGRGFLDPEVLAQRGRAGDPAGGPIQPDPLRAIVHFRNQLAARGIDLVLMPVPVKPAIHPDKLSPRVVTTRDAVANPSYATFLARLHALSVKVFDPTGDLLELARTSGAPAYLESDTHWTPTAMRHVAGRLATFLADHCDLPAQPALTLERFVCTVENDGDLASMLKVGDASGVIPRQCVEIERVLRPGGQPWSPSDEADVLFLGDSFSTVYSSAAMGWGDSAGLVEHTSATLGRPIDCIVRNAGGSYATREALAAELRAGRRDRLGGKRVVVWQFADRDLAFGDWRLIDLPQAPSGGHGTALEPSEHELVVRARVLRTSRVPDPSEPYEDALTYTQYAVVEVEVGVVPHPTIIAIEWSMRRRVVLGPARYRSGDLHRLRLTSYAAQVRAQPAIEQIQALDDLDDHDADLYWVQSAEVLDPR